MSSETIARWNAIPLEREAGALKRPRPEDDDSDDDVSIVSRTPSPPPTDQMDIDKYDEYVSRPAPEVITVETKIKPTNKGFAMLAKLGWVEGQPLGVSGDGRVDPVPFQIKRDSTGLGKWTQDARMIETTVSQRRGMDSEKMTQETEEQRKAREDHVARRTVLESELSTTIKAFYCDLCEKQFKTVVAYTEHTNSYAHHHKARFKDMQANVRIPQDDLDKRKEKERKREEKELRKIAAANGIKMPKPAAAVSLPLAPAQPVGLDSSMDIDGVPLSTPGSSASGSGFKKLGWATVGSSNPPTPPPPPPQSTVPPVLSSTRHPDFRAAGWTSLESGSSQSVPPPPPPSAAPPPPPDNTSLPPPRPAAGGWATVSSTSTDSNRSRWTIATPSGGGWSNSSSTPGTANASSAPPHPPSISATPPPLPPLAVDPPTSKASAARSGWQQFQRAASKRR